MRGAGFDFVNLRLRFDDVLCIESFAVLRLGRYCHDGFLYLITQPPLAVAVFGTWDEGDFCHVWREQREGWRLTDKERAHLRRMERALKNIHRLHLRQRRGLA